MITFTWKQTLAAAVVAAALVAAAGSTVAATDTNRNLVTPNSAQECSRMIADARQMLADTDSGAKASAKADEFIATAETQCAAGQFVEAGQNLAQARLLLAVE